MNKWALMLVLIGASGIAAAESRTGWQALFNSPETIIFIVINLSLTIYLTHIRFNRFSVTHGPEILTTSGIFGCFIGIALALLNFDTSDIAHSVPSLLEGVKTAFWASVTGVGGALYLKFRHYRNKGPIPDEITHIKATTLEDVVVSMHALRMGLVGDEPGTLMTQFKLLRQENTQLLTQLTQAFDRFAQNMVENNQKAIVEALKKVIDEFNQELKNQFGENFKQLNSAVEKLVLWQEQYKDELEQIKFAQEQASRDLQSSANSLTVVVTQAERFATIAVGLDDVLKLLNERKDTLYQQERELATLLGGMQEITPMFAHKVDEMLSGLKLGVTALQADVAGIVQQFSAQSQTNHAQMHAMLNEAMQLAQRNLNQSLTENAQVIATGVASLDAALQKELNQSLETLGRQLAALSQKFVDDYSPLTDKLRQIVQMTSRV